MSNLPETQKAENREKIEKLAEALKALPDECKVAMDTMHLFTDGMYARTVLMKAGELIVGKIHNKEHIVVISAGRAKVFAEEIGEAVELRAPSIFISPPGSRRTLLIEEDMVWTTIHSTPERDLVKLEAELIAKTHEEVKPHVSTAEVRFDKQTFTNEAPALAQGEL